jgi:hypothetical protein
MNRNDPLKCFIDDGILTMRIGVEVLAKAIELDPGLSMYDEATGEFIEPKITDVDKFAEEVLHAIKAEGEDGTTLIHQALDRAAMAAIEMGAEGIKLPDDILRDRRRPEPITTTPLKSHD